MSFSEICVINKMAKQHISADIILQLVPDGYAVVENSLPYLESVQPPPTAKLTPEALPILQLPPYPMPIYSQWFDATSIHTIERQALPELFTEVSPYKTAYWYIYIRNFIIKLYRDEPQTYLTATKCRRILVADACAISMIHEFLEKWSLINFEAEPADGYYQIAQPGGVDYQQTLQLGGSEFCGYCGNPCHYIWYTHPLITLCAKCFGEGNIPIIASTTDFQRQEAEEEMVLKQYDEYAEFLDIVKQHQGDWQAIAEVLGKSIGDCMLQFLQIPIKEQVDFQVALSSGIAGDIHPCRVADGKNFVLTNLVEQAQNISDIQGIPPEPPESELQEAYEHIEQLENILTEIRETRDMLEYQQMKLAESRASLLLQRIEKAKTDGIQETQKIYVVKAPKNQQVQALIIHQRLISKFKIRQMNTMDSDSGFEDFEEVTMVSPPRQVFKSYQRPPLPQCLPLVSQHYSIEPDMALGWRPKIQSKAGPIPLNFDLEYIPVRCNQVTHEEYPTIYHGFRPSDSMEMHELFSSQGSYKLPVPQSAIATYNALWKYAHMKTEDRPFQGMKPNIDQKEFVFNSKFECGNLDRVVKINDSQYDLYMRVDANTKGHHQWFYFSVTNIKQARKVKFNIVNFTKKASLYQQGMKVRVLSDKLQFKGWQSSGENIWYGPSCINEWCRRRYYQMSFEYSFMIPGDTVYFAYAIPYTYSRLTNTLTCLKENFPKNLIQQPLCNSLSGFEVPILTITDFTTGNFHQKDHIIVTARVHPGETHASWAMEGFLNWVLSDGQEAKELRRRVVIKVVPMLNIDGVVMGNYRSSFSGNDLNRRFNNPDQRLHPVIFYLKQEIYRIRRQANILHFIDIHAHSKKKGVFMYAPHYPLHQTQYFTMRILPKIFSQVTDIFRFYSCKFHNEASKRKAARLVLWNELDLCTSYTLEISFQGFIGPHKIAQPFTEEILQYIGQALGQSLHQYIQLDSPISTPKSEGAKQSSKSSTESNTPIPRNSASFNQLMHSIKNEKSHELVETWTDSDASSDELHGDEQIQLQNAIFEAIEAFVDDQSVSKNSTPKPRVKPQKPKATVVQKSNDFSAKARSTLAKFFSRAPAATSRGGGSARGSTGRNSVFSIKQTSKRTSSNNDENSKNFQQNKLKSQKQTYTLEEISENTIRRHSQKLRSSIIKPKGVLVNTRQLSETMTEEELLPPIRQGRGRQLAIVGRQPGRKVQSTEPRNRPVERPTRMKRS